MDRYYKFHKIISHGNFKLGIVVGLWSLLHLTSSYRYLPEWPAQKVSKLLYKKEQLFERHRPTHITDVPFFSTIVHENSFCSGTLIGSRTVLTTATCVAKINKHQLTHTVVKVGSDVLAGEGQVLPVIDIKMHEYYRRLTIIDNDIALVIVATTVPFSSRVKKALLIEPEVALRDNLPITMLAWGNEDNRAKEQTYRLIQTLTTVMDRERCLRTIPHLITPSTFCVAYKREHPLGDIGGPAIFIKSPSDQLTIQQELLVGITSYNGNNITLGKETVAVITNVSHFYWWIHKNMLQLLNKHCVEPKPSDVREYEYYDAE